MKLSAYYNRATILTTISVLFLGAIVYFFAINKIVQDELDRDLSEEVSEILEYVNEHHALPKSVDFDEDQTTFTQIGAKRVETRFFDAVYINPKSPRKKNGRAVEGSFHFNGQNYKFLIVISKESTEYLVQIITVITLILVLLLLATLFLINRFILKDLWKPFFHLLKYLKGYEIADPKPFLPLESRVEEFGDLTAVVNSMTAKVKDDYDDLKQFTENASHEMLTPLSVITSKLDSIIQDESMKPEQFERINDIYDATGKLTRLNQSLLLLVKIENKLIQDNIEINLQQAIAKKVRQFQDLINMEEIKVTVDMSYKQVIASGQLLDILLNNLIGNALRHNHKGGILEIVLNDETLTISNSGKNIALNQDNIFNRFSKGKESEGAGLGLSLIKNICSLYNWDINYSFVYGQHVFKILFN